MKFRLVTNLKISCREHKWDMQSATALNSLLIPVSFPQGSFFLPLRSVLVLTDGMAREAYVQLVLYPLLCSSFTYQLSTADACSEART